MKNGGVKMNRNDYYAKMMPHAERASGALGIPKAVILAQWSLETGSGSSSAAQKLNNHAGIKANSQGADYNGGTYAGYNSLSSFTTDYIRVMNLSYYDKVRQVGKTGDIEKTVKALDDSPWAEDKGYYGKIMNIISPGGKYAPLPSSSNTGAGVTNLGNIDLDGLADKVKNLNPDQMVKFALIGLAVVGITRILD